MSYNDRFIYLMRDFNDDMALNVIRQLFDLDNKNKRDIFLIINSNGGDLSTIFAIHDVIKLIKSDVSTVCIGRAYSAAACLLISGKKGKRFITKHSDIMFHELSSEIEGKISAIRDEMESLKHYDGIMQELASENLGTSYKKVLKRRKEAYYNAQEALDIGAVDYIINSIDDLAKYTDLKTT